MKVTCLGHGKRVLSLTTVEQKLVNKVSTTLLYCVHIHFVCARNVSELNQINEYPIEQNFFWTQ